MRHRAMASIFGCQLGNIVTVVIFKHRITALEASSPGIGQVMRQHCNFMVRRIKSGTDDIQHGFLTSERVLCPALQIPPKYHKPQILGKYLVMRVVIDYFYLDYEVVRTVNSCPEITNALVPYSTKGDLVVRPDNVLGLEQLVDGSLHFTSREEVNERLPDILGRALARIWIDKDFNKRFSKDQGTLEAHGIFLPENTIIEFQKQDTTRPRIVVYEKKPNSNFKLRIFFCNLRWRPVMSPRGIMLMLGGLLLAQPVLAHNHADNTSAHLHGDKSFNTAVEAVRAKDYQKAVLILRRIPAMQPDAQYNLAVLLKSGKGRPQDFRQALVWSGWRSWARLNRPKNWPANC